MFGVSWKQQYICSYEREVAAMHGAGGFGRRRRPFMYWQVVVLVSVAALFALMSKGFSQPLAPAEEYIEVVVQEGDTLWQIARRYSGPEVDARKMVDMIRDVNDLSTAVVRPGQVLKVPVL